MSDNQVLLEIGVEEIPARFLPQALRLLKEVTEEVFRQNFIGFHTVKTYATPRRLSMIAEGVPLMQEDRVREVFGPAKKVAFAPDGTPTKAAIGFANSQGVKPEDLVIKTKGKGEYVVAVVEEKGLPVKDVLPEALKKIILSLHFPKSMRWGTGTLRFVRPVHWILALFGKDVISFEIDGIQSGDVTYGHRFLSPAAVRIEDISAYQSVLENSYVIVDQEKRKELIIKQAEECARSVSGALGYDDELISTVTFLVEYPHAVLGSFSEEYLELPEELLISVMKDHQKFFSVKDSKGNLKNYFIVVSNTKADNSDIVRAGAERVIRARFEDAKFYFREDKQKTLFERLEELRNVTYHDRLGSLYDKTMRVKGIAEVLSDIVCPDKKDKVERAVLLSKTDLITGVVQEFPELQGIMGMYYALHDGEDREVAVALREQYLPAYSGDRVPESDIGAVVSLSDRMDNIASFFSIGLKPTGSEDPFALRRHALAVVAILIEKGYDVSIKQMLEPALSNLSHIPESKDAEPEILRFFEQRLDPLFQSQGYSFDIVQAVISFAAELPLKEVTGRLDALKEFKSHPEYNSFLLAIKRVRNIIPSKELPGLRKELLKADEEIALMEGLESVRDNVNTLLKDSEYSKAIDEAVKLTGPINRFFDNVLVMDKDEAIRDNRLSLLSEIWSAVSKIADFSKLSEEAG
jgi:glycyl-tRNA synthetase beta chain